MKPCTAIKKGIPRASEADVQRAVKALFQQSGCVVYDLSQGYRNDPRGTRQTPGLPDLWCFVPRKKLTFWFEVKAHDGRRTDSQIVFGAMCAATSQHYGWGGVEQAKDLLRTWGMIS